MGVSPSCLGASLKVVYISNSASIVFVPNKQKISNSVECLNAPHYLTTGKEICNILGQIVPAHNRN